MMRMKRLLLLFSLFFGVMGSVHAWVVADQGSGVWTGSDVTTQQDVRLTIPTDASAGINMVWGTIDDSVAATFVVNTGQWTWVDDNISRVHTFTHTTNTWEDKPSLTAASTETWTYNRTTKTWTQTVGGTDVWGYDESDGYWKYDPDGTPVSWLYTVSSNQWTHNASSSVWSYEPVTRVWSVVSGTDPGSLVMPAQPLIEQAQLRTVLYNLLANGALGPHAAAQLTTTGNGDNTWTGSNAVADQIVIYDSSVSGFGIVWKNNGAHDHQKNTVSMEMDYDEGDWKFTRSLDPLWLESWLFDSSENEWTNQKTGEAWAYNAVSKQWSRDGVVWQHNSGANTWTYDPAGTPKVWEYNPSTDQWVYDPSGETPSIWVFSLATDTWTEVTSTEQTPAMPPTVVVQRNLVDVVADALDQVGAFAVSGPFGWQTVTQDGAVYKALNASGRETVTYTPSSFELAWASPTSSPTETFTYNISTGAWTWTNQYGGENQTFTYDEATGEWDEDDTLDFTYANTDGTRTWTSADSSIVWTYQPGTDTWKSSETNEWKFYATYNTWTRQSDDLEMRYSFAEKAWSVVGDGSLPDAADQVPRSLVQQALIENALQHFRVAGLFSTTGSFGWTMESQGAGVYQGDTAADDERLVYDPTRIPYMIHNRNKGALVTSQDTLVHEYDINGDWRVTRSLDVGHSDITSFARSTGLWTDTDGTTPWQWKTDNGSYWHESVTERKWTRNTITDRWVDSVSSAEWSYNGATAVWTNHTATTTWKFDMMADVWTQLSGDAVTAANMPPQPLREQMVMRAMYTAVEETGVFVAVQPMNITLTDQGDDTWKWDRVGANDELVVDPTASGRNRLRWNTEDESRSWKCNPENGDWVWEAIDSEEVEYYWEYDSATGVWKDVNFDNPDWKLEPGIIWRNQSDTTEAWQYDPITRQWINVKTNERWGYYSFVHTLSSNDVYSWINITNKSSWVFDDRIQSWTQAAGVVEASPSLPPRPVRQMTLIHVAWRAALVSGVFGSGKSYGWTGISRQSNGTWVGVNADDDQEVVLDTRHATYHIQSTQKGLETWAQSGAQWWLTPSGAWQWRNRFDPFVSQVWAYDPATLTWSRSDYTDPATATYAPATRTWTHTSVWQYDRDYGRWVNSTADPNEYWYYNRTTGVWTHAATSSEWTFNHIAQTWTEVTDPLTNESLTMPPLPVVQHEVILSIEAAFMAAGAFEEHAQPTWNASEYNWYTTSASDNAQAQYDVRETYQLSWQDTHTQNRMQYNTATGDWIWRADAQHWQYNAATGLWGRDKPCTPADNWIYSTGETTAWTKADDAENTWTRGEDAYTWRYQTTGPIWTYEPATNDWRFGLQRWMYNFALDTWIEATQTLAFHEQYPPLPLVQQMFVLALRDGMNTFFDNPLYAAARQAPPKHNALHGTRPLTKNSRYDRYNASSVLINADITLDHVTWVHNDVSRNHGRLQLPSVTETALPAILGGDRAGLFDQQFAPRIILYDSTIACHEPLVSAGVRWNITDRPIVAGQSPVDAHNYSSIIAYNKGRVLDMPQRRGVVFQLGSQANRMANGTITTSMNTLSNGTLSTSTLRDAYLDIYRAQTTLGANADEPTQIDCALKVGQESGVPNREKSMHALYLTNRSRVTVGWPTSKGASGEKPWSVLPATITTLEDAHSETLFSASSSGGGSISVAGANWYLGGRDATNQPPKYPVSAIDQDAVLYVEHGGILQTTGTDDLFIDTIVARRIADTEEAGGRIVLASDQVIYGSDGKIQPHSIDFTGAAASTGTYVGHVRITGKHGEWAIGSKLHGDGTDKVK